MTGHRVSVIIPTYNREKLVQNAINSVLQQTLSVGEIIVVDDGSVDGTREALSVYGDKIVYIYQDNNGVSSARNTGIRAAKGDWIAFLDSDDTWMADKTKKQIDALYSSGADVCCSGHKTNLDNKYINLTPDLPLGEHGYYRDALNLIFRYNHHPLLQSMIIKKSLILKSGLFDETLDHAEDTKFLFGIPFVTGISYINEPLFVLNRTKTMSRNTDDRSIDDVLSRYECCCRAASDAYWRLIRRDAELAKMVRSNIGGYMCRISEIHLVKRNCNLSRLYAVEGFKYTASIKIMIRCLILLTIPWALQKYLERKLKIKWGGAT